jgi:hypothetical protein
MTPSAGGDRYEPLPSLVELPGFLVRKLSRRGRRAAAAVAGVLVAALAAGLVVGMPAITRSKDERAAAERRAEQERRAQLAAALQAEMRPRSERGTAARGLKGAAAIAARRALAADLAAAVHDDAVARVRAGELTYSVERVECERFPRGAHGEDPATELARPTGRYHCLAVTAEAPRTETTQSSSIGYPYRALVHFPSGRFTFCKVRGRPGEGSISPQQPLVPVPPACGGTR